MPEPEKIRCGYCAAVFETDEEICAGDKFADHMTDAHPDIPLFHIVEE